MLDESNTPTELPGSTDSNQEAQFAWQEKHTEDMQALEGMDPEDQRHIESYERGLLAQKGVPLGEPIWGGGPPDKDAGILGDTAALGAALVVGGLSDTIGAIPAGMAGLTALTAEAVTGTTPSGADFYGESSVSEAGRVVESISNLWNEHITTPAMDFVMPESLEDDTHEMHQRVQAITVTALDAVARGAAIVASPTVMALKAHGVDTGALEAAIDAHSRGTATLALLVMGMKSLPGMKGAGGRNLPVSADAMDSVLGAAAHEGASRYLMTPEQLAQATRQRPPAWEAYQAGKAEQAASPADSFGAPPPPPAGAPRQPGLPGMEPQPLQQKAGSFFEGEFPPHPQQQLPFETGYPQKPPGYRPMTNYVLEGDLIPADAPLQPMSIYQVKSIIEGTFEDLTPSKAPRLERYQEPPYAGQGAPPVKGGGEVPPGPPPAPKPAGKQFKTREERAAKGGRVAAEDFDWRNSKEVRSARHAGVDPYPQKKVTEKDSAFQPEPVADLGQARAKKVPLTRDSAGRYNREPTKAEAAEQSVQAAKDGYKSGQARRDKIRKEAMSDPMPDADMQARVMNNLNRSDKKAQADLKAEVEKRSAPTAYKTETVDAGNGLPAEWSHLPVKDLEFLPMPQLREIAATMNNEGVRVRGKKIAGRTKEVLAGKIREGIIARGGKLGEGIKISKEAKSAYETHVAMVDEINGKMAAKELASGKLSPMDRTVALQSLAADMLKEMAADAAGLARAGVTPESIVDVLGGLAKQRVAAGVANQINLTSAMGKLFQNSKVKAILKQMPEEMQKVASELMAKVNKAPKSDRADMLAGLELGKTLETQHLIIPPSKGASAHIAKFTVSELVSLYRELMTAEAGIFVPGRGVMTKLKRGYDNLKQQAVKEWGSKGIKAQEGLVSAREQFYTPAEFQLLKQLIDTARHDFPTLSAKTNLLSETFADAMVKFRMDVTPEARARSGKSMKYTLEDHGITVRETPGYRGKPGEQGYFNLEAFNLLDPLRKKWQGRAGSFRRKGKKKGPESAYKTKGGKAGENYTGATVTKKDITRRAFLREYIFGGKMIGALQRKSILLMDETGSYALARLTAMLDQFPKSMWREKMGNVQSFYQLHTKAFADLIADSGNGVSLAATLAPFQGKLMSGVRRYFRYVPGGLTQQRIKPAVMRSAFEDLTSGQPAVTPLGQALRRYADYLYTYGKDNGVEMATYMRNWYPVILRGFNKKKKAEFIALVEKKATTPEKLARARAEAEHIMEVAFENGGLISADMKPGLNGKHLNAELSRQFFDRFTMEELRPFIVNDPGKAMYGYAKGMARRVANNARWGKNERVWRAQLHEAQLESAKAGYPLSREDVATLEAGRQILAHTYQTAPTWYIGMMRLGIAWQNAAKLGLVVVGSLAEIGVGLLNPTMQKHYATAIAQYGVRGAVQHTARAIWRDVPQTRARRLAEAVGRSVDVEMHDVLTATHAADLQSMGSNMVFQLNGLHALTNMLQDINVAAFEGAMKSAVVKEFNHRLGRRKKNDMDRADAEVLSMYGIEMEAAMKWYRDGAKIEGAFWDQQYAPALIKYLNETVMTPRGVNMPRWMSNPWLAPIRHLLTYTSVFANTVLPDMWFNLKGGVAHGSQHSLLTKGRRGSAAFGGIASIYGLGWLAESLLDEIKYGGEENHPLRDKIKDDDAWYINQQARFLNRTGVYGLGVAKLFDAYESYRYGRLDYRFIDGAFLTEAAAGAEVLGLGLLAGEIDARQAAKWLVRNGIPVHAATIPRDKDAPLASFMPSRPEMEDDLAKWLDDHVPGVDRKSRSTWKPK